ncbi:diguanylate cyclase domain-containing protein [Actinotalea sp.]|uniref:sensor domain-containing diguanylate cyclase n=1 Tax=Actinotalea sp. TaxID=1872145 RepID=UPI00356198E6
MNPDFYAEALDQVADGVYALDRDRRITYWNAGSERISGYAVEDVIGRRCSAGILRHVDDDGRPLCRDACPLEAVMRDGESRQADVYLHHVHGHRVPVTVRGSALRDEGGTIVGAIEVFTPTAGNLYTEQVAVEPSDSDGRDTVTGLPVRRLGEERLEVLLARPAAEGTGLGVLFIDADHFKVVNDTHGHATGDRVLRMIGRSIAGGLRRGDLAVRWGGEEFLALLPEVDDAMLRTVAERVRMLVEHSWIQQEGAPVRVTVSVGATLARPGADAEACVARADALMYESKRAGRNRVTVATA